MATQVLTGPSLGLASVGAPVVHRYLRDDGEDWSMWFHARDSGIDANLASSALGTGRVHKASSKDGLVWVPDEGLGVNGCALDVNTDEWWGFDAAHLGLGDVRLGQPDKVLTAGGVYTAYFFGGTYESKPAALYDGAGLTSGGDAADAEVAGATLRIGIALSQNGINWSRLEGEHPSGASLDVGRAGEYDALMVGWPNVVNHHEQVYRMYYGTFDAPRQRYVVALATSPDGFKWDKLGQVFAGSSGRTAEDEDANAFDAKGVCRVHVRKLSDSKSGKVLETDAYTMVYEGHGADGRHCLGLATSPDGIAWAVANGGLPILEPSGEAWEGTRVGSPRIVEMGDGTVRLYYTGTAADGTSSIGAAVASVSDLTKWTRL